MFATDSFTMAEISYREHRVNREWAHLWAVSAHRQVEDAERLPAR